ncbi:uncharacterized protein LOC116033487 [Ipomoea triloba]|uniref:uncharacterized protein LOC116033487 n=1 Tax=Ipomoea triloba TaxID=35885 RepID=UPI00125E71C2|nr:uncharacterized protein LOC116033487 [Ipomoea triloba]
MIHALVLLLLLTEAAAKATSNKDIHELLRSRGLPAGLFPKNAVEYYDLDEDGRLEVFFEGPCVAKYETRVMFERVVRANLSYGGMTGLEGLSQEELFLWLPVKGIKVYDPSSGLILFDIGVACKELSLSLFEDPPICLPQGALMEVESGLQIDRYKTLPLSAA